MQMKQFGTTLKKDIDMANTPQSTKKTKGNTIQNLVEFIEGNLIKFPDSQEFVDILERKKNENQHSLSFCVFMTNLCKSTYYFGRENNQKGNSVIDIGVYLGSKLIFTIEAKLLPTPPYEGSNEYQYVYGKGGGIQRFKEGKHGLDNTDNPLLENGMIAYIKDKDFAHWHTQVNQWIIDAGWGESEKLNPKYENQLDKYKSQHKRGKKDNVTLHHFWVKVNAKA